jgi:hypothetical protein
MRLVLLEFLVVNESGLASDVSNVIRDAAVLFLMAGRAVTSARRISVSSCTSQG